MLILQWDSDTQTDTKFSASSLLLNTLFSKVRHCGIPMVTFRYFCPHSQLGKVPKWIFSVETLVKILLDVVSECLGHTSIAKGSAQLQLAFLRKNSLRSLDS